MLRQMGFWVEGVVVMPGGIPEEVPFYDTVVITASDASNEEDSQLDAADEALRQVCNSFSFYDYALAHWKNGAKVRFLKAVDPIPGDGVEEGDEVDDDYE